MQHSVYFPRLLLFTIYFTNLQESGILWQWNMRNGKNIFHLLRDYCSMTRLYNVWLKSDFMSFGFIETFLLEFNSVIATRLWLEILYKKTDGWYIEWQWVKTSDTTSDDEWQRVVQRVARSGATNDNEWSFRLIFLFLNKRGNYY